MACSGDATSDKTATSVTVDATDTASSTASSTDLIATTSPAALDPLDFNSDGQVVFGVATDGPADGGGWSQTIVDAAHEFAAASGFAVPIVLESVMAEEAATLIDELAQQAVDVIILGAAEIAAPLAEVITRHPDIYWYCVCGGGVLVHPGLAQSVDSAAEIGYTAGYATGLLLDTTGGRQATVIGCCDLGIEQQIYKAFEAGLQAVDRTLRMTYVRTGEPGYDFDNIGNATAAFRTAVDERTHAVLPYLDGAHRAVVIAANAADVITMSAGSSRACNDADLNYDIAVRFDGGEYLRAVLPGIIDGTFLEGTTRVFKVGVDPEPGAIICKPTSEQQAAMETLYGQIGAGDLDELFSQITARAFPVDDDSAETD